MMKRPDIARKLFHQYTSKILFEPINRKIYRTNLMCNGNLTRIILHCRFFTHSARSFSSSDKLPESKVVQTENLNPDVKIIQPGLLPKDPAGSVPPADKSTAKAVIQETQAEAVERIAIQKDVIIVEPVKSKPELKVEPPPPPTPPEGEKKEKKTAKSIIQEAVEKVTKKRIRVDLTASSVERNFITPVRAMSDFLLKPSDLENLRATKRRSPYENEPPITVFWRKDVEARAIEVWGSKENLTKELLKRDLERRFYQQNTFTTKRKLRDYRREKDHQREQKMVETAGLFGPSGKVVLTAVAM
ncbi:zinc transporter 9-like [Homalodisca vitripennis]|uniref:zinc transporter 9-like n=1 Tax=Homalodisca vitripennis TaxID=197043 RepID=UPI001EEAC910|nr:zinc transporter 9-like [Homalodisca vitripennis]